ncbi:ATP-binding cassette domain-containing protein [Planctomycetota bacterium]|nr:ATP-binding cassette domain-containing protein [Planctomycetota bacterium]
MCSSAITVNNLSKRYTRGQQSSVQASLYEAISNFISRRKVNHKKTHTDFWALKDINFDIERGESVGIIGHNGAGKSTLLKILSRITDPTDGQIQIAGRVASLLEVGTGFHPELTGLENIYLNGTILGMTRAEITDRLEQIIEFSGIQSALDTPVKRYSSGMRVRLAFAVAAHLEPEILIVDEVLAVGDMNFQRKCLGKMQEAYQQDRTVLFVSHNLSAVQTLCNRCIWLEHGHVKMIGETTSVISKYLAHTAEEYSTDTSNAKRTNCQYGQDVKISQIIPQTTHQSGFYLNQSLTFNVTIDSTIDITELRFGICISDMADTSILSSLAAPNIIVNSNSSHQLTVTVNKPNLAPGDYSIGLAIGQGSIFESRKELDVVSKGPSFTVLPITQEGKALFNWYHAYGPIVHTDTTVTQHPTITKKVA